MTIHHDAYGFVTNNFIDFIVENTPIKSIDVDLLITTALKFADSADVAYFMDIYGGWDYESLKQDLYEEKNNLPYLANSVFMIYLYKYLTLEGIHYPSLENHWHHIISPDTQLDLYDPTKNLLIYGKSLESLTRHKSLKSTFWGQHLVKVKPLSTGSWCGYMPHGVSNLLLEVVEQALHSITEGHTYEALQKARKMLIEAVTARKGICMISSG